MRQCATPARKPGISSPTIKIGLSQSEQKIGRVSIFKAVGIKSELKSAAKDTA
jgi:hypothetical protein